MRAVQASITVPGTTSRALNAFLDADDLRAWWGVERALVEPREGGLYVLTWGVTPQGFQYVTAGIIGRYQVGQSLRIDHLTYLNSARPILGPMSLTVHARAGEGEAHLEVTQDGYGDGVDWNWYYDAVRTAWPVALGGLQTYLTGRATPGGQ